MSSPFDADQLFEVGEFLTWDLTDIGADSWNQCGEARARSAASRSYYSVFLHLKHRVEPHRHNWRFPHQDIHKKVHLALTKILGDSHGLVHRTRSLLRVRKRADYELHDHVSLAEAEVIISTASDALDDIDALSTSQLREIANEIFDLDRS